MKGIVMKHYRSISFIKLFSIIFALLFAIAIFVITGTFKPSIFLDIKVIYAISASLIYLIYISFGDSHLLYILKETAGFKFFRSAPNAPKRFKKYCITLDIIFFILGLTLYIPLFIYGFSDLRLLLAATVYMLCFGIQHIISTLFKFSMKLFLIEKGAASVIITLAGIIIVALSKYSSINFIPYETGIFIVALSLIIAVLGSVLFNKRIEKNWNNAE